MYSINTQSVECGVKLDASQLILVLVGSCGIPCVGTLHSIYKRQVTCTAGSIHTVDLAIFTNRPYMTSLTSTYNFMQNDTQPPKTHRWYKIWNLFRNFDGVRSRSDWAIQTDHRGELAQVKGLVEKRDFVVGYIDLDGCSLHLLICRDAEQHAAYTDIPAYCSLSTTHSSPCLYHSLSFRPYTSSFSHFVYSSRHSISFWNSLPFLTRN